MVHVVAERPHPSAGWRATRVEVTEMWQCDQEEERRVCVLLVTFCVCSECDLSPLHLLRQLSASFQN